MELPLPVSSPAELEAEKVKASLAQVLLQAERYHPRLLLRQFQLNLLRPFLQLYRPTQTGYSLNSR